MKEKRAYKAILVKNLAGLQEIEKILKDTSEPIEDGFFEVKFKKPTQVYFNRIFQEWSSCEIKPSPFDTIITVDQLKELLSKP